MIDFFENIYNKIENRSKFLSQVKYYACLRFIIRNVVNIIAPLYFLLTHGKKEYLIRNNKTINNKSPKVIITLTSFPGRINRVWLVIETILRQSQKPDRIILWLSKEQFTSINQLPIRLISQTNKGLEIRFVDGDLKSHKKYYYTLKEFPDDIIITIDDDILYPSWMIEDLITASIKNPQSVVCRYACVISYIKDEIIPYDKWVKPISDNTIHADLFFGSGGGTLFPAYSLSHEILNEYVIKNVTPLADDVLLNAICRLNNIDVIKVAGNSKLLPVIFNKKTHLSTINIGQLQNDHQIKMLREYSTSKFNIDPFKKKIFSK